MKLASFFGSLALLTACATQPRSHQAVEAEPDYCAPASRYTFDTTYLPRADVRAVLRTDTSLTRRFSPHDLLIANATGVLPLLHKLVNTDDNGKADQRLERIELHQKITNRLLLASTEIASLAAELDCEGERADRLATYLDQKDTRRVRRLTLASVVVGAITTVATALMQSDQASKITGIAGGLVSGGLGGVAAFSSNRSVRFTHQRNLLADIWYQSRQSTLYSPFVWYVLTEKSFSNSGQNSISFNTRQRWQTSVLDNLSPEQERLYFGEGGAYQADDLHTRSNMLNQVQSSVRSISQDLQSLLLNLPE